MKTAGRTVNVLPGAVYVHKIPVMGFILAPDKLGGVALFTEQRLQAHCVDIAVAGAVFKAVPYRVAAAPAIRIADIAADIIPE